MSADVPAAHAVPMWQRASTDLLDVIVDAEITELLGRGRGIDRARALRALAARAELADRLRRHHWLAVESARRAGASWAEIDVVSGVEPGAARDEYEATLAEQKAFGLVGPDRADPGPPER